MWQSAEGKGHVNDNVHYNQIQVDPKNINLNIGNKITADMSVKDSVAVLASQPQLAYMAKILNDPATSSKVNWSKVQEAHDQWDYKQSGLTPAAGAIVALAVAVATSGAGANAVGLMTGTSSSTALASYGVSTAAMQAAITTLASKATVSMINNQGDLGAVFNELGSSDSIKQLATAVITAGAVSALGSAIQIQGDNGAMMSLDQVTAKAGGGGLVANIGKNLINGVARATITSAITNTSLEQSLQTEIVASVLNAASASAANAVGDAASGGIDAAGNTVSPSLNEFGRALAHAVVGCMAGAAGAAANASSLSSGNGCSAGAIGAVVGELSATYFNSDLAVGEKQKVNTVEFASLMAGIAGALTGQGPDAIAVAASTGGNAAANNYLNHTQWQQLADRLAACRTEAECGAVRKEYLATSIKQDQQLAAACADINSTACRTKIAEATEGTKTQMGLIETGKLPANFAAGSDYNKNVQQFQRKAIAADIRAACEQSPACVARGEKATMIMGLGVVGVITLPALVALAPEVAAWIIVNPIAALEAGMITVETAAAIATNSISPSSVAEGLMAKAVTSEVKFATAQVAKVVSKLPTDLPTNVYHAPTSFGNTQSVLNGINPVYFNTRSRFLDGFYVSEQGNTAIAEVAYHAGNNSTAQASHVIGYDLNLAGKKVLDLTDPQVAKQWAYNPVNPTTNYATEQAIAKAAQNQGFDAIRYPSQRAPGSNLVIYGSGLDALKPRGVSPAP